MGHLRWSPVALLAVAAAATLPSGPARAQADVNLSGPDSNQGTLSLSNGSSTSLWNLLGGNTTTSTTTTSAGTTVSYGDITTFTPTGDYLNNPILQDYLVATNSSGQQSLISLGEIDPSFVGTAASSDDVISVSGSTANLDFLAGSGASGRDLSNIVSLQLLSVAALPATSGGVSTAVTLTGASGNAGSYDLSQLQNDFTPTTEMVNNDTYTGVALWTFLDPTVSDILNQYVVVSGTDGYEVVFSLAELDSNLGGNSSDLLPYADTGTNFSTSMDGLARVITPSDQPYAHGRWVSNVDDIEIVPEPASLTLLLSGLVPLAVLRRKRRA
jgi:hypothetical protein